MYCRKCGKEIEENSKFCPYCGYELKKGQDKPSDTAEQNVRLQKTDKIVSPKKRIIPVVVVAGTIIIAIVAFLGIKAMRKPEETSKSETVEGSEPIEEEHAEYPQEISLDENVQQEIVKFLELLCEVDTAGSEGDNINRMYSCTIDGSFAYSFIFQSLSNEISFVKDEPFSGWSVPEETLTEYLQNSINHPEYECNPNGVNIADGIVTFEMASGEMLGYKYNTPKIDKITQIAEDEIEITGSVDYTPAEIEGYEPYTGKFDIVMFENANSIWGGYTLKEIKSWGNKGSDIESDKNIEEIDKEVLSRLLYILGNVDYRGDAGDRIITELSAGELGDLFLYYSLYYAEDIMGREVTAQGENWVLSRSEIAEYLQNSLGSNELSGTFVIAEDGDYITIGRGNPPYVLMVKDVVVTGVERISDTEIKVLGEMTYRQDDVNLEQQIKWQITMAKNAKSVWCGYTIKDFNRISVETGAYAVPVTPEEALEVYVHRLVDAINTNDYSSAEYIMPKGSPIYNEQEVLVS